MKGRHNLPHETVWNWVRSHGSDPDQDQDRCDVLAQQCAKSAAIRCRTQNGSPDDPILIYGLYLWSVRALTLFPPILPCNPCRHTR